MGQHTCASPDLDDRGCACRGGEERQVGGGRRRRQRKAELESQLTSIPDECIVHDSLVDVTRAELQFRHSSRLASAWAAGPECRVSAGESRVPRPRIPEPMMGRCLG
ncbi:hypothetical protein ACFPRL_29520 [Pseudoclavibacter helvolus]